MAFLERERDVVRKEFRLDEDKLSVKKGQGAFNSFEMIHDDLCW